MNLQWETSEDGKHKWLRAGGNSADLAWLQKRAKWWSLHIWLPGLSAPKEYGPLDVQQDVAEQLVTGWFDRANEE